MKSIANNTLVAIVPSRRDWDLIRTQDWYRIPVRLAPPMVKDSTIEYIAFYFPSVFGEEKQRSNSLNSRGWSVLHFTTKELTTNIPSTIQVILDAIAQYGGSWYEEEAA